MKRREKEVKCEEEGGGGGGAAAAGAAADQLPSATVTALDGSLA